MARPGLLGGQYQPPMQFMRSEFFYPAVADRQNRAAWEEAGKQDTRARVVARARELLQTHKSPGLPPEIDAATRAIFNILL